VTAESRRSEPPPGLRVGLRSRTRYVYLIGLLATALIAALVGWRVLHWALPPDLAEIEAMPVFEEVTSPKGTWTAVNHVDEDYEGQFFSYVVVSPRDGSSEPRLVYDSFIADLSWQGDSTIVVRRHEGGKERLDAATASIRRFKSVPWSYVAIAVTVLVPTAIVLGLGIALTIVIARSRRRHPRAPLVSTSPTLEKR